MGGRGVDWVVEKDWGVLWFRWKGIRGHWVVGSDGRYRNATIVGGR